MMLVNNVLRSVYRANSSEMGRLNILTMCRNTEKYISLLSDYTPHTFYILEQHPWNVLIEKPRPNIYQHGSHSPPLDCIICYDRAEQYEEAQGVAHQLHIPIILVDMCSRELVRPQHILENLTPVDASVLHRKPTLIVCNDEHIQRSWNRPFTDLNADINQSIVIPAGINTDKFKPRPQTDPLIAMDNNTSPQAGAEVASRIGTRYRIIPTDHDNSEEIAVTHSRYFINTKRNITVKTLEAMSAGNVVICQKNADTESLIEHGKTGILLNNLEELLPTIDRLEKSESDRLQISNFARQKIIREHSVEEFSLKWASAFSMIKLSFYLPAT